MKVKYQIIVEVEADGEVPAAAVLRLIRTAVALAIPELRPEADPLNPPASYHPACVGKVRLASSYVVHEDQE